MLASLTAKTCMYCLWKEMGISALHSSVKQHSIGKHSETQYKGKWFHSVVFVTRWAKTQQILNFICRGRFPAKLRLLYQGVTGGLHCIILNYEAQLCYMYYKDATSLNSQAGQWNTGTRCYGQLKHALSKKGNFTSFQSVYGCLSVYVSPHFHHRCLFQLSLPTVFANFSNCLSIKTQVDFM